MLVMDLARKVQAKTGMTLKQSKEAIDAMLESVAEALEAGEKVNLTGFGAFVVRKRRARKGVNPRNPSQKIDLPESIIPGFRAGKSLKDRVAKAMGK
ncbi:MAG: HU family DNA-binding protein [Candidatus Dojkabacteria bacterium]|nr:HU family DNA-binding protein [Candidatus Dojkabacteria bacterium]